MNTIQKICVMVSVVSFVIWLLLAIENIFNTSKSLSIKPIVIYSNKNTIIAELEIVINDKDKITVLDIIKFDDLGKISAIRAYRG